MLEDILNSFKRKILPAALAATLTTIPISNSSAAHINEVLVNDQKYIVEFCSNGIIQVPARDGATAKLAGMYSLINNEKEVLERNIKDLDYSGVDLARDSYKESRILSKKLNKIKGWWNIEEFKIHPWLFIAYGLPVKLYAYHEAIDISLAARKSFDGLEQRIIENPTAAYREIIYHKLNIENAERLIKDLRKVTTIETPFTLKELRDYPKDIRKNLKQGKLGKVEEDFEEIVDKLKKALKKSKEGQVYFRRKKTLSQRKIKRNPFSGYEFVRETPQIFFYDSKKIDLYDWNLKRQLSVGVDIIARKSCIKENSHNLRLEIIPQNIISPQKLENVVVLNTLKTNLSVFHPKKVVIGESEQSASFIYNEKNIKFSDLIEILPSKRDKLGIDASKEIFDLALKPMRGNIIRIRNLSSYGFNKISKSELSRDQIIREMLMQKVGNSYAQKDIKILPTYPSSKRIISIPFSNVGDEKHYATLNIGMCNFYHKFCGRLEDIVIEIPNKKLKLTKIPNFSWVFPSRYVEKKIGGMRIKGFPVVGGRNTLDPQNGLPEFITISLGYDKYSFIDQQFFDRHSIDGKLPVHPLALSKGSFHMQLTSSPQDKEDYVKGVYFGNQKEIAHELTRQHIARQVIQQPYRAKVSGAYKDFFSRITNLGRITRGAILKATGQDITALPGEKEVNKDKEGTTVDISDLTIEQIQQRQQYSILQRDSYKKMDQTVQEFLRDVTTYSPKSKKK